MTKLPEKITRCWQYNGYHVYQAGPCFDTLEQATNYKEWLDERDLTWHSQDEPKLPVEFYK